MKNKQFLKTTFLSMVLAGIFQMGQAQVYDIINSPEGSYFEKQVEILTIIDSFPETKSDNQLYEIKMYNRWNWFWQNRVNSTGNLDDYPQAMQAYYSGYQQESTAGLPAWESLGPTHQNGSFSVRGEIGHCKGVWVSPTNPDYLLLATHGGGFWKSVNGGTSWVELGGGVLANGVQAFMVDPTNNQVIYVATGLGFAGYAKASGQYCSGVWKSTDGGATFTRIETGLATMLYSQPAKGIIINPASPQNLLVAFHRAIYRSTNGGASWAQVYATTDATKSIMAFESNPLDPNLVMACGDNQLIRSTNGGQTWMGLESTITLHEKIKLTLDFDRNNQVYLLYVVRNSEAKTVPQAYVYRSNAYTINWGNPIISDFRLKTSIAPYVSFIKISPEGNIFAGGVSLNKFNSDGSFNSTCNTLHADIRGMAFASNTNEDVVYVTHDGGVSKSTNTDGTDYTQINNNLALNEFYDVAISPSHPGVYLAGAHDNHSFVLNGPVWLNKGGGDGGYCMISQFDINKMCILQNSWVSYSSNSGNSFVSSALKVSEYNCAYFEHPAQAGVVFAPYYIETNTPPYCIVKSTDYGNTWDLQTPFHAGYGLQAKIAINSSNPNIICRIGVHPWPGNQGVWMYKTIDGGTTWTGGLSTSNINTQRSQLNNYVTSVWESPTDANYLMISFSGMETGNRVYYTTNGGNTWTNFSTGLPNLPVNKVLKDAVTGTCYAATDVGVFYRESGMASWHEFNNGLPKVMVTDIELNANTHELVISTYGRGAYKACLACTNEAELVISDNQVWATPVQACGGLNIATGGMLTINAETRIPDNKNIVINAGTLLIESLGTLKDVNGLTWTGTINVINGGQLIFKNSTPVTFGSGTTIEIDNTSSIDLQTDNCLNFSNSSDYLRVNGTLKITGNIDLHLTSGYIILNGTMVPSYMATLNLEGANKTTKLLEVQKSISFDTDFANVTIQNGKVVMNNSTSELYFNSGIDNITLDNIWVTSSTGSSNSHQGIDIRSNGNITVTNSTFEQGYYGLYASRGATSPNLDVSNCTFKYCSYGLRVYNGGLTADGCTVEYNTVRGIYCNSMDLAGTINNSTIRYQNGTGDYGLYYDGASTATLTVQYTTISSNYYGAMVNGSFNSLFKCNTLNDNTDYGIYSNNSPVYLANATGISAGNNQLYSNNYGIKIYGTTSMFYLNNGNNELRSDTYCMYGTLEGVAGGTIAANNNCWKTGGGAPVSGTNYVLNGALSSITLTDNSPESAFYLCETPGDLMEGASTTGTTEETSTYRTVTTDLGTLPLNETVEATLNSDAETGTVFDDETQFNLMSQTLNNNLAALTTAEEKQATHTYRMFRSNLGKQIAEKGTADAAQLENMLQVIEKLKADEKQGQGKKAPRKHTARYFALSMDEAQTLWLKQEYDGAITLLQSLTAKATDDQLCEIQKMICQVEADREFVASNNTLDIEELLALCSECSGSEKSGSIHSTGNGQQMVEQANLLATDISLSVIPHPVTGNSEILVKGLAEPATITVYNSLGAMVFHREVTGGYTALKITRNELEPGIYLISLNQNGATLQTHKMVVQ